MFGTHTPTTTKERGAQSPMAVFTRGLQVGGTNWTFEFDNGYGASVINDGYGGESGLYELAVIGPNKRIAYDTPLTSDVLGYLTTDEVAEALDRIAALTPGDIERTRVERESAERRERMAQLREELADLEAREREASDKQAAADAVTS